MTPTESHSGLKGFLLRLGFRHFRWFRRWCGGVWQLRCDFKEFVEKQHDPRRYPRLYMTKRYKWILDWEDYRDPASLTPQQREVKRQLLEEERRRLAEAV